LTKPGPFDILKSIEIFAGYERLEVGDVFKALADPTRRKILELLKAGDLSAGDIADSFDIGKPSISHHLTQLKEADLVLSVRKGQSIVYSLNTTVFQEVLSWVLDLKGSKEAADGEASPENR
jgi:DNA-binding transcriptional ArsR family regulator